MNKANTYNHGKKPYKEALQMYARANMSTQYNN